MRQAMPLIVAIGCAFGGGMNKDLFKAMSETEFEAEFAEAMYNAKQRTTNYGDTGKFAGDFGTNQSEVGWSGQ